jgi:23S rRNA (uracil1939-C5)-methyltransferase
MTETFSCPHLAICAGCAPQAPTLKEQQSLKLAELSANLQPKYPAVAHNLGVGFLRTRMDVTWSQDHWGFWSHNKSSLMNLQECHQVTPELQKFFSEFKKIHWPAQKASARLRVSPTGELGVWLDMANEDIKKILIEGESLKDLTSICSIEIGQKRKSLIWKDDRWRLADNLFKPWISTFMQGREVSLYSLIGGFSQTGPKATKVAASLVEDFLASIGSQSILEFGSGAGTLTLPAASNNTRTVYALEVEERALAGLKLTLHAEGLKNVHCLRGDFQRKPVPAEIQVDTYLVNPPRSGVQKLFSEIPKSVRSVIYMSCYPESFFKDAADLTRQGFELHQAHLIDQFPQTPHAEWMSLWSRQLLL